MQKPLATLLLFFASATMLLHAEKPDYTEDEYYDAKVLFTEFQKLLRENPDEAKDTFEAILQLPDSLQGKVQQWLDKQWAEGKRAYWLDQSRQNNGGGGAAPELSPTEKLALKENRALLLEIRGIANEDEMKGRLKAEGWDALGNLMRITNPKAAAQWVGPADDDDKEKMDPMLEKAMVFGFYRYQIRKARNEDVQPPTAEITKERTERTGVKPVVADSEKETVYPGEAGKVLRANEAMKSEIPRAEYDGILELNHWRIALGLKPLLIDPKLCDASRDHSKDMGTHGFFAHESPVEGKKSPWDRAKNFGTSARAENIAINGSTGGANRAWFYSPGHHKNMFANHTYVGLGANGRHFTQMFR